MIAVVFAHRSASKQSRNPSRSGEGAQVAEAVETGAMAIAEVEPDRVVADALPANDLHAGKTLRPVAAIAVPEDVALAEIGGAGRSGAQLLEREISLSPVIPRDGD